MPSLPPALALHWPATHRLIPAQFSEAPGSALADLASSADDLTQLLALQQATDAQLQAEQHGIAGIGPQELVYAIPNAHIVNGAFTHPGEFGGRFHDWTRGAWYCARSQATSIAEVAYHKARRLAQIGPPGQPPPHDASSFDDWLADFQGVFHQLQPPAAFTEYLQPEPVPACYQASQAFARHLIASSSVGLTYPSVRVTGSSEATLCLVCFRPALVYRPRRAERLLIAFTATGTGYRHQVTRAAGVGQSASEIPVTEIGNSI